MIGLGRRHTGSDRPGILIMRMSQNMFDDLLSMDYVKSRPMPGLTDIIETIFSPESFPIINQGTIDGIVEVDKSAIVSRI